MMQVPDPCQGVLLALGAFRLVRLVGWDDITIRPRRWVTGMGDTEHHEWARYIDQEHEAGRDPWMLDATTPPVSERRYYWSKLLRCPWCFGFWASLGIYVVWRVVPVVTLSVAVPFALSAVVGLVAKNLDP